MAAEEGVKKGRPLRHIVLLRVKNEEDVAAVVQNFVDMGREIVNHITMLSFYVSSDLGILRKTPHASLAAQVSLVIDFPDEENLLTYMNHDIHKATIVHNKRFGTSATMVDFPLPESSVSINGCVFSSV